MTAKHPSLSAITSDQLLEGLYAWLKQHPWVVKEEIDRADLNAEAAAREALLMLARGDSEAYRALPEGVRALACRFLMDLIAKLIGPMSLRTWPVSPPTASIQQAAWRAIAIEIDTLSGKPGRPH